MTSTDAARQALRIAVRRELAKELRPPVAMTLVAWADEFRRLSRSSGAIGGRWQTSRFEIARGPMMGVTEPGVQIITMMICTQLMKTEVLLNVIGRFSHLDPCPMLLVQPKDEAVDSFSKERLGPMVTETPVLRRRFGDGRTRRADDTLHFKRFPGGFLALAAAGSPTNLAMRAIRVTLLDEVDKYEVTKEGDPVALAEERSSTFPNRLNIRACSPTWEESSRIYHSFQDSDQRRPYLPCPHCGHFQTLDFFRHVHWEHVGGVHRPQTAAIFCEGCGAAWTEGQRLQALRKTRWHQTRSFTCCGEGQDPRQTRLWEWEPVRQVGYAICKKCRRRAVSNRHAGFTASKLYSPRSSVVGLAEAWLLAKDSPETKQTFYNTQLALPFKAEVQRAIAASALATRGENWPGVPREVCVITAGVDVQPGSKATEGRLEVEVVGWGPGEESWSLAHEVFTGDPAQLEVWAELDAFLLGDWQREDGHTMTIRATCVDSGGHNTQEAYNFARARIGRNVWAIKGASDRGGQWSPVWPAPGGEGNKKNRKYRAGYRPVIIGVNAAKEAVRQRLLIEQPGPGYCHFPVKRPPGYFDQMTAEQLVIERKGGAVLRKWVLPSGKANEALDCRVYSYAALCGLYVVRRFDMGRAARMIADIAPKATAEVVIAAQQIARVDEVRPVALAAVVQTSRAPARGRTVRRGNWAQR